MKKIGISIFAVILSAVIMFAATGMADEHTHSYGDWNVRDEATCAAEGTKVRICVDCGNVESEAIAKTEHSYGEWNVRDEATCAAEGTKVRICANCGNVESEAIAKAEHSYGEWNVRDEATCAAEGTKVRICANCGNVESEAIAKTEHSYSEWNVRDEATEDTAGTKVRICVNCGNVESETIPAKGQNKDYLLMNVSSVGPRFKDVSDLTNKWFMFSAVDLSKDGVQTLDLIAGDVHKIGTVTLTVADGAVTVDYDIFVDPISVKSEFFTFFSDLEAIETLNTAELTGYNFGEPITLGEDTNLILYLHMSVFYTRDNDTVEVFRETSKDYTALVADMMELLK